MSLSLLLALPLFFSSWGTSIECSTPEVVDVLGQIVLEKVEEDVKWESHPRVGGMRPLPGQAETILGQFTPRLQGVFTLEKDDERNIRLCRATLVMDFTDEIYAQAEAGLNPAILTRHPSMVNMDILHRSTRDLPSAAAQAGLDFTHTSIADTITYQVQLSDDNSSFYVEMNDRAALAKWVHRVVAATMGYQQAMARQAQDTTSFAVDTPAEASGAQTVGSADTCLEQRIAGFRSLEGEDAPIRFDVLQEWEAECQADG